MYKSWCAEGFGAVAMLIGSICSIHARLHSYQGLCGYGYVLHASCNAPRSACIYIGELEPHVQVCAEDGTCWCWLLVSAKLMQGHTPRSVRWGPSTGCMLQAVHPRTACTGSGTLGTYVRSSIRTSLWGYSTTRNFFHFGNIDASSLRWLLFLGTPKSFQA